MLRRPRPLSIALASLALLAPASADAAVTLGPEAPNPDPASSQAISNAVSRIVVFTATAPSGVTLAAPTDGVITGWQLYTHRAGNEVTTRLVKLRPLGGTSYAVNGAGAVESLPPANPSGGEFHNVHHSFSASLPIAAGEIVGVELNHPPGSFVEPVYPIASGWRYGCLGCLEVIAPEGSPSTASLLNEQWVAMNARLEPDADRDGLGDETQDSCVGSCAASHPTTATGPSHPKKKGKRCKKGFHLKKAKGKKKRCVRAKHGHRSHGKR